MMSVISNLSAMNAQRQYGINSKSLSKSTEKLSSGYRINRAADDAAGLQISEKMRSQIRGLTQASSNCQDGVSLCQVADGALNETHSVLQRMNELCIKSANGTNTDADREAIQNEVEQLSSEIDRIANSTTFNDKLYPLKGKGEPIYPTKTVSIRDVSWDDVTLANLETHVGWTPFGNIYDYNDLDLTAEVNDKTGVYPKSTYNMIFQGNTSFSSVRMLDISDYLVGHTELSNSVAVPLSAFTYDEGSYVADTANKTWQRSFSYLDSEKGLGVRVTQKIQIDEDNKNYIISNSIQNIGSRPTAFEFLMNMDTAYNNNDRCEQYYIDKNPITNFSIYNTDSSSNALFEDRLTVSSPYVYDSSNYPSSISIVNEDVGSSLPFSEKISFTGSNKPVISIGRYAYNADKNISDYTEASSWNYYESARGSLGQATSNADKTATLIWSTGNTVTDLSNASHNVPYTFTYTYGIDDVSKDSNVPTPEKWKTIEVIDYDATPTYNAQDVFIQAGAANSEKQQIKIDFVDASNAGIGLTDPTIDVSTKDGALSAINRVAKAINTVSNYRSSFGSSQNRLEHTISNLDNIVENTQSAESQIRDTDMAKEMVNYSLQNILAQTSTSMLSQANQNAQSILSLLQ